MSTSHAPQQLPMPPSELDQHVSDLKVPCIAQHYDALAQQAATQQWSHVDYLATLTQGAADVRRDRATQHRIRPARVPVIKTLDQFRWDWPTVINRMQVPNHFRLGFIKDKGHVIYLGGVGLGKTHRATAVGYTACLQGYSVLLTRAIDVSNTLRAAQTSGRLKQALKKDTKPSLLILDERGYLPIDKAGADLLFQVLSRRYEQGSMMITSHRAYQEWPKIFHNDSTLTSAILDRLLHHAATVVIAGKSFRMQGKIA